MFVISAGNQLEFWSKESNPAMVRVALDAMESL